ncbi:MAG: acyltransferase family protein [Mycetocola sp.]
MSTPTAERERWIDTARALAILLVVLFHAVLYLDVTGNAGPWPRVNNLLDSFRMPLFFALSGLLAASAMTRPFRSLWSRRLAPLLYLYALWCIIQHGVSWLVGPPVGSDPSVFALLRVLVLPDANLWFIVALPLYLGLHWMVRSVPPSIVIGISAAFSLVVPLLIPAAADAWIKPVRYLVFFTLGLLLSTPIRRYAFRITPGLAALIVGGYLAAVLGLRALDGALSADDGLLSAVLVPTVRTALGTVAVAAGIALAVVISRQSTGIAPRIARLGQLTLPIYLIHTIPLMLVAAVPLWIMGHAPSTSAVWGWVAPPIAAAVAIWFSLLVHRVTSGIPGLYALPVQRSRSAVRT